MKAIKFAAGAASGLIFSYLCMSFIEWSINPEFWTHTARMIAVSFGVIGAAIAGIESAGYGHAR